MIEPDVHEPVKLGNYELLAELATGGMGSVYIARQSGVSGIERLVVIKRVHPHLLRLPKFREMFRDEARVASLVQHANVVRLIDVLDRDGELLIVFEYVESVSLAALQRELRASKGRLPLRVAVRILADVLDGLSAAHDAKDMRGVALEVVHRDVSPQNVIVGTNGISHLIDFGIAKATARLTETTAGGLKGKLGYMSPEQAKGLDVDRRSDLFSAGIVLHEALTGTRLFENDGGDGSHVLLKILLDPIATVSTVANDATPALDAVVERSLERIREERFQTAAEFRGALVAAIAPAANEEVAKEVYKLCGASISRRRAELEQILEGLASPRVTLPPTLMVPQLAAEGEPFTEIAVTVEEISPSRRRWRAPLLAALALVASGSAFFVVKSANRRPPVVDVDSSPMASASVVPSAAESAHAPTTIAASSTPSFLTASDAPLAPRPAASALPFHASHSSARGNAHAASSTVPSAAPAVASAPSDIHNDNPY